MTDDVKPLTAAELDALARRIPAPLDKKPGLTIRGVTREEMLRLLATASAGLEAQEIVAKIKHVIDNIDDRDSNHYAIKDIRSLCSGRDASNGAQK